MNTISVSFDTESGTMSGTSRITLPPETPLALYSGELEITGSLLERKGETPLIIVPTDDNIIRVPSSSREQTIFVSWKMGADGTRDNLISGQGITLAGLWHPLPDIDMAYRLEARLPDGFTAISEGDTVAYCLDRVGNRYLTTEFDHPVRSIHFAAGPYRVRTRTLPGDILLSAFFFEEDLHLADEYLDKATEYIGMYEKLIGPYPYNRYSIVENRLPTGYGMPTFTLLGQAVVRLPFITETSLGHEVLHSWFGNSVQVRESGGNWSEGLTTYLADQYYAEQKGEGWLYRKNQLIRYASYVPFRNELTLEQFSNPGHSQPLARQVRAVGYDKSAMVFHMLRNKLGDDLFFAGLQKFYLENRYRRAGWEEIEDSFTSVSGTELADFFDQWLTRWDIPKLDINYIDITQKDGRSVLSFTVKQKTVQPYSLDLPVTVATRSGETRKVLSLTKAEEEVEIVVDTLPRKMVIDPDYDLMRMLTRSETPPVWSRFMGAEYKIAVLPVEEEARAIYRPFEPLLEELGAELVPADELDNSDLDDADLLFLGPSIHSRGLFADPGHTSEGVTIDVRNHPLAPGRVAVLVTSPDVEQTQAVVRKLRHYGKYSFLQFTGGRAVEKRTTEADRGIQVSLFRDPAGVRVPDIRSFDDIIDEIQDSRVVYVGETHTDLGAHVLQLQVIQALYEADPNLAIGMEMFPRSSQEALDRYINGEIATEKDFLKQSRYFDVWGFDYRYYRDIIGFAHRHSLPLVGLNIDKEVVSTVFREGSLDGLEDEQALAVPEERKLDMPGYRQRLSHAFTTHDRQRFTDDKMSGFIQAQSIWDETMAETIATYLRENPERKMVVIAGNGHVYKDSAIPPRVARRLDVTQSVLTSIRDNNTALIPGYKVDYLLYTSAIELEPAPKIGVVLKPEETGEEEGATRLRVLQISPHGKAGEAGLREKDIILSVDGQEVQDIGDIRYILLDRRPGDSVVVRVLREHLLLPAEELELEVELSAPMQSRGMMPPTHPR
ncbi:MAG: hypothetical protein Kow0089_24100 [Desulfobulbaceae bacterium]